MASVSRRPLAALDILDIWDHIADDNMMAADRWVDELDKAFGTLATQPKMGRARPELAPDLSDGIDVVRVLHSARDIDGLLPGKP
ncbi:MAG: type II toxin-antitoxin system RelE/ParE family toxin [Burkholderiaceae bacterium]|nr:type II toxin-antitoxin system RelE/ParE family toxin [Burkholderiaceae bacterium]